MSCERTPHQAGEFEDFARMGKEELLVSLNAVIYDDRLRTPSTVRILVGKLADWELLQDREIEKLCLDALKFICRLRPELISPEIVEEVVSLFEHPNLVVAARAVELYGHIAKSKPAEITSSRVQKLANFVEEEVPLIRGAALGVLNSMELKDSPVSGKIDSSSRESSDERGYEDISPGVLRRMLREGCVLIIDNRTEAEFEILKSPRLNELIPLRRNRLMYLREDEPDENLGDLLSGGEDKIVVLCRSGHRSSKLCQRLVRRGCREIYNLRDGMINWKEDD